MQLPPHCRQSYTHKHEKKTIITGVFPGLVLNVALYCILCNVRHRVLCAIYFVLIWWVYVYLISNSLVLLFLWSHLLDSGLVFTGLSLKSATRMTGRAPPPARTGRQEKTEGKRVISEGWAGGDTSIELRAADERDCQSDLPDLLPTVVVITQHIWGWNSPLMFIFSWMTT